MKCLRYCHIIIFLFFLPPGISTAQNNRSPDSLLVKLEEKASDIEKVNILNKLADRSLNSNPAKASEYSEKAISLARKKNYPEGLANAFNNKGMSYYYLGDMKSALDYYLKSLEIREEIQDKIGMASSYNNIGILFKHQGNFRGAIEYYMKSLKITEELGDKRGIAISNANIGNTYFHNGNDSLALEYLLKALQINLEMNDEKQLSLTYGNIGKIYTQRNQFTEALDYLNKALSLANKSDDKRNAIIHLNNIAHLYSTRDDYENTVKYSLQSAGISRSIGLKSSTATSYRNLAAAHEKIGKFKEANDYNKLYAAIKDTIFNEENSRQMAEMQTKYETEKKQQEIDRQQMAIERRNFLIYVISAALLLFAVIGFLINIQLRSKAKRKSIELQQKLLRSQMNPHFIFNALLSIQNYMFENDTENAAIYLSKFSTLVRLILDHSMEEYVVLSKEVETLEYYLELQKLRFENKFSYTIHIDSEIDTDYTAIPPMLAQPFIENAIEHGLSDKRHDGLISIGFRKNGKNILFEVVDNGVGLNYSKQQNFKKNHISHASKITRERLFYLNKGIRKKIKLEMEDLSGSETGGKTGTRVKFTLPYKFL